MNDTERLTAIVESELEFSSRSGGKVNVERIVGQLSALLDEARLDELEHLPWKRSDRYGINSPYVTKQWLVERKAQLTPRKEQ